VGWTACQVHKLEAQHNRLSEALHKAKLAVIDAKNVGEERLHALQALGQLLTVCVARFATDVAGCVTSSIRPQRRQRRLITAVRLASQEEQHKNAGLVRRIELATEENQDLAKQNEELEEARSLLQSSLREKSRELTERMAAADERVRLPPSVFPPQSHAASARLQ
jgi:hypothetical protein